MYLIAKQQIYVFEKTTNSEHIYVIQGSVEKIPCKHTK